jgi:hypothetical protein
MSITGISRADQLAKESDAGHPIGVIGDPTDPAAQAAVTMQALVDQYGIVVRDPRMDDEDDHQR